MLDTQNDLCLFIDSKTNYIFIYNINITNGHHIIVLMKKTTFNYAKSNISFNQTQKSTQKLEGSSIVQSNLSKYKFIPPSKILKNKNTLKAPSLSNNSTDRQQKSQNYLKQCFKIKKKGHYQSLTQPDVFQGEIRQKYSTKGLKTQMNNDVGQDSLRSPLKANHNFNKKREFKLINNSTSNSCVLQNYEDILHKRQHFLNNGNVWHKKMFRSISTTKIDEKQANQKIGKQKNTKRLNNKQNNGYEKNRYQGVSHSMQVNSSERYHIQKLTKFIEQLKYKQQQYMQHNQVLQKTNRKLISKIKQYEKLHQQIEKKDLIIIDLTNKIKQYQSKTYQKCHQHSLIIESLKKIILSQKTKIIQLQTVNTASRNQQLQVQSWMYEDSAILQHNDCPNLPQNNIISQNITQTNICSSNLKSTTPSFGNATPDDSRKTINQQDLDDCQLLSSSRQQNLHLQELSRIQESAESMEQSSMQILDDQNVRQYENNRNQEEYHPPQHQQLLNEIDQYLSKWNKRR